MATSKFHIDSSSSGRMRRRQQLQAARQRARVWQFVWTWSLPVGALSLAWTFYPPLEPRGALLLLSVFLLAGGVIDLLPRFTRLRPVLSLGSLPWDLWVFRLTTLAGLLALFNGVADNESVTLEKLRIETVLFRSSNPASPWAKTRVLTRTPSGAPLEVRLPAKPRSLEPQVGDEVRILVRNGRLGLAWIEAVNWEPAR